jgi:HK97 family phage prohead protease
MPYEIRKQGDQFCVMKQGTDQSMGCHPSNAEAMKQMAALYANEPMARSEGQSVETRQLDSPDLEFRSAEDGLSSSGYPALYGVNSQVIKGRFTETINQGAFDRSLNSGANIILNVDHNDEKLLASTKAGSLRLSSDARGLRYEARHAPTSYANDLAVLAKAGEIRSMSFSFKVPKGGDKWSADGQNRSLSEVKLVSIAILTGKPPAYPEATTYIRSLANTLDADLDDLTLAVRALSDGRKLSDAEANLLKRAIAETRQTPEPVSIPVSIAEKRAALDALEATFRKSPESPASSS